MATDDLTAALHACATGLYPLEAGVALLISNGTFLDREDFTCRFIETGTRSLIWECGLVTRGRRRSGTA